MSFETNKLIRIIAEYQADGVWDDENVTYDPEYLPLPADLVERIRNWQAWYDRDYGEGFSEGRLDVAAFSQEGWVIARAVKAALPDWTVIYSDEAKYLEYRELERTRPGFRGSRLYFQFEISHGE